MSNEQMTIVGFAVIGGFLALCVLLGLVLKKRSVKTEDADILGQVKKVIEKVIGENNDFSLVPAITKQTTADMVKEELKEKAFKMVTGHTHYFYEPEDNLIIAFKDDEIFMVPYVVNFKDKVVHASYDEVTHITSEDIKEIKCNSSASSVKIKYKDGDSIFFGAVNEYYKDVPAKENKELFAKFINDLARKINN